MKSFFLSLKTTVWTLLVLVCAFFIGSSMMPVHREIYAPMNDRLLFDWVSETASGNLWATWWFFAAFAGLILLTINTISCSIQAVKGRWSRTDFLLRISPQVVHIGFLFILLAHLMGAGWGYRLSGLLPEGATAGLPENRALMLQGVRVETDEKGFLEGWTAAVTVFEGDSPAASGTLGPNRPLLYDGVGVYLKSFGFEPAPYALLMVNKDPGAVWALVGSILFMIGSVTLLVLKWKKA
jgi:cytochrome c biogenesis protein ResB